MAFCAIVGKTEATRGAGPLESGHHEKRQCLFSPDKRKTSKIIKKLRSSFFHRNWSTAFKYLQLSTVLHKTVIFDDFLS
ncbi:hypothetical protein D9754_11705 [Planomicrobium sp. Y74]|nr:hypothetical protein D9754_11705 [Planomicrobium sp. Y74]